MIVPPLHLPYSALLLSEGRWGGEEGDGERVQRKSAKARDVNDSVYD